MFLGLRVFQSRAECCPDVKLLMIHTYMLLARNFNMFKYIFMSEQFNVTWFNVCFRGSVVLNAGALCGALREYK